MATSVGLFKHVPKVARARRDQQELTQKELARRARVSTSTVSRIERGTGGSFASIDQVLGALGLHDWIEALGEFARAAARREGLGDAETVAERSIQQPIVFRLSPGESESLTVEIRTGYRRLLFTISVYDYTPNVQGDLFPGE